MTWAASESSLGKNAVLGLDQEHFTAQVGECLGHFTTDGTGPDDPQTLWLQRCE